MGFGKMSQNGIGGGGYSVPTTLSEINVTPLVDVMLVLLIVFMISAPLMQQGVQVDLPKANAGTLSEVPDQIVLRIAKSRQLYMSDHLLPPGSLSKRLEAIVSAKPTIEIVIEADQTLPYGYIAQVMAEVKRAGISRMGLATQPGETRSKL